MLRGHGMDRISELELFAEGDDLYASMLAAIEGAERAVRMESYIFAADEVGRRFASALATRARGRRRAAAPGSVRGRFSGVPQPAACGAFSEPWGGMPKEARKVIGDVTRHIEDEAD